MSLVHIDLASAVIVSLVEETNERYVVTLCFLVFARSDDPISETAKTLLTSGYLCVSTLAFRLLKGGGSCSSQRCDLRNFRRRK